MASFGRVEKRNHPRFDVQLPVVLIGIDKRHGIVTNVSMSGCQLDSQMNIPSGKGLMLRLSISSSESPVEVEAASVRWCAGYRAGLAFLLMDTIEQARLSRYLSKLSI
jgi:hypothetical protein